MPLFGLLKPEVSRRRQFDNVTRTTMSFWHTGTKTMSFGTQAQRQSCAVAQRLFSCAIGSDKHNKIRNTVIAAMTTHKRETMKTTEARTTLKE
jgi:hypothetical protein